MWIREYSKFYPGVRAEVIWHLWTDINNWHRWHSDLEYCKLEGEFVVGNHFMLKPKGVKSFKIELVEIHQGVAFTDLTRFPGAKMYDTHSLEETHDGVLLKNKLIVTGPLKWLWIKLVAQNVADTVPDETEALVLLARQAV